MSDNPFGDAVGTGGADPFGADPSSLLEGEEEQEVNWDEVPDSASTEVPDGWAHLKVAEGDAGVISKGKGAGKTYIRLACVIQNEPAAGRYFSVFLTIPGKGATQKDLMALKMLMGKCGIERPSRTTSAVLLSLFRDKEFWGKIKTEVYQGNSNQKIAPWDFRSMEEGPGK